MVDHGGGCVLALPRTFLTQGVAGQLGCAELSPSVAGVEAAGFSVPVAGVIVVVYNGLVLLTV